MSEVMKEILKTLEEIRPGCNFAGETALVDGGMLDSFEVIQFISEIGDKLDVDIPVEEIIPENFNSLEAIEKLIESLMEL